MSVVSVFQLVMAPKKRKLQLQGQTNLAIFFNNARATDNTTDDDSTLDTGSTTSGPGPPNNSKTKPQIKVNCFLVNIFCIIQ